MKFKFVLKFYLDEVTAAHHVFRGPKLTVDYQQKRGFNDYDLLLKIKGNLN